MENLVSKTATYKIYFYGNAVGDIILSVNGEELNNILGALLILAKGKKKEDVSVQQLSEPKSV